MAQVGSSSETEDIWQAIHRHDASLRNVDLTIDAGKENLRLVEQQAATLSGRKQTIKQQVDLSKDQTATLVQQMEINKESRCLKTRRRGPRRATP